MAEQKCNQFCPWVQNSQNFDHYICLKCGKERLLNRIAAKHPPLGLLVMMAIAIILTIFAQNRQTVPQASPQLETLSQQN